MSSLEETLHSRDHGALEDHDLRFVISVDYGTTYTGVAWILTTDEPPKLSDISVVQQWAGGNIGDKVPSEITYTANSGQRWGYGIGADAVVLRWTKLDLPKPPRGDALNTLLRAISDYGQLNVGSDQSIGDYQHLIKTASNIVTDYLREVADCVRRDIEAGRPGTLNRFPIDIVITHPAEWDYRARNLTFKAVNDSFGSVFHEYTSTKGYIRMVTEPEACAQYAMKDANEDVIRSLRKDECFIVVDAGGGTVDLVAYRVDEVAPNFRVTKVTKATGDTVGATCIDRYFVNEFLRSRLSQGDLDRLRALGDAAGHRGQGSNRVLGQGEQFLLQQFMAIKHNFAGQPAEGDIIDEPINLPNGVGEINNPATGIRDGQLFIRPIDMKKMFEQSVRGTVRLIEDQIMQLALRDRPIKAIFLSGGFSQSPYLCKKISEVASSRRLALLGGQDATRDATGYSGSWPAVAIGAVIMGLGMGCTKPAPVVQFPYDIGIKIARRFASYDHDESQKYTDSLDWIERAKDNIKWIIGKGDLILPDSPTIKRETLVRKTTPNGNKVGTVVLVNLHSGPRLLPTQFSPTTHNQELVTFNYDLSSIVDDPKNSNVYSVKRTVESNETYYRYELMLEVTIDQNSVHVVLACGKKVDRHGKIEQAGIVLDERSWAI
ncbi:hypothetical protein BJ170DRAFT_501363 [Xylariales sp. AK1849]|nr:hypothetical protein BJ170DRAFT_501363 [Xylariales sp. AK1849]